MNRERNDSSLSAFSCNLAAHTPEQRKRHTHLFTRLAESYTEIIEMPEGYMFTFLRNDPLFREIAEWITLERLCCPFLSFEIEMTEDGGPTWLRLRGRAGVKEFLAAELGIESWRAGPAAP